MDGKGQVMGGDVPLSPDHCRVPLGRKQRPHTGWGNTPSWLCLPPVPPLISKSILRWVVWQKPHLLSTLIAPCRGATAPAPAPSPASLCNRAQGSRPHGKPAPVTTQNGWPGLRLVDTERDAPYRRTWILTCCLATEKIARGRWAGREQES